MIKARKNITKKVYVATLSAVLGASILAGCGKKEATQTATEPEQNVEKVEETVEEPVEEEVVAVEEQETGTVVTPFLDDLEKYDSIISGLTKDQYYAFAEIGEDYDALLVTDGVYDYGDGIMAAIDAKVYGFGNDGIIYEAGSIWSDGTAYPISVYEKSIMFGGNHRMAMACVRDGSIIIQKEADEVFDEQGNATYSYNEGNIDDIREVPDDSILTEMFEMFGNATVVNFFQGEAEVTGDMEIGDYPSNSFEERVGKTSFSSYDEIIGLLEGDEAYALVNVKGYDGEVLLITNYTYDDLLGHIATTECTPYTLKSNGNVTADSLIFSGGTATPVTMDNQGVIFSATHTSVEKSCYGDNGTDNASIMMLASVYADELDDNGTPKTVGGFVRTKNSVIDDDSVFLNGDEIDIYKKLFAEYEKTEPISFTRVGK